MNRKFKKMFQSKKIFGSEKNLNFQQSLWQKSNSEARRRKIKLNDEMTICEKKKKKFKLESLLGKK